MSRDGDKDEYQLVVEATPPPATQRRPRAANPAVDDVIQSGEINVPRSLVVRSRSHPSMPVMDDDPEATELTSIPTPPVAAAAPAKRRVQLVWLLAALAPAVAAIALELVKPAKTAPVVQTAEADSVAQLIGTTFDGEVRGAQVRAEAIASSSMLRAAIQTDANTLADMAKDRDVVFPHKAGESIEVFQLAGTARNSMLRIPPDAPPITPPPPGSARLEERGGTVVIVADASVTSQSGAVGGEIALVAPIDLTSIQKRPYEHLTGVTLTGFATPIVLGGGAPAPNGSTVVSQVTMTTAKGPALAVTALVAMPKEDTSTLTLIRRLRLACAGLALAFVLMFGVSLLRR